MSRGTRNPALVAAIASLFVLAAATSSGLASNEAPSRPQSKVQVKHKEQLKHGEYLVQTVGCGHCHTPGALYGEPDPTRLLSGSEVGWKGRWGVCYPRNLTPDVETGLGKWSVDDIVKCIRELRRPDGTVLRLPMPWFHFIYFTEEDARAIATYLKSIPPVSHKAPDFIPPDGKVTGAYIELPPAPAWDAPRYR